MLTKQELYLREIRLDKSRIENTNQYPYNLPVLQSFEQLTFQQPVTILTGENGAGKSTLIEAIAVGMGFNPEGGSRNFQFSTKDTHSGLSERLIFSKGLSHRMKDGFFYRAESFYNLASEIDELNDDGNLIESYGGVSLHECSHGESTLALLIHRLWGNGLYIFDEPESALSPTGQFTMLNLMHKLVLQNSQIIIATHSPLLLGYPDAQILQFDQGQIQQVDYERTSIVQLYTSFLHNSNLRQSIIQQDE